MAEERVAAIVGGKEGTIPASQAGGLHEGTIAPKDVDFAPTPASVSLPSAPSISGESRTQPLVPSVPPSSNPIIAEINKPNEAGMIKVPVIDDAIRARELEVKSGIQNPKTIAAWNEKLIQDYNDRVETPTTSDEWVYKQEHGQKLPVGSKIKTVTISAEQKPVKNTDVKIGIDTNNPIYITKESADAIAADNPEAFEVLKSKGKSAYYDAVGYKKFVINQALEGKDVSKYTPIGFGSDVAENVYNLSALRQAGILVAGNKTGEYSIDTSRAKEAGYSWDKIRNTLSVAGISLGEEPKIQEAETSIPERYVARDASGEFIDVSKEDFEKYKASNEELRKQKAALAYLENIPGVVAGKGQYNLAPAIAKGVPDILLINAGFSKEQIGSARENSTLSSKPKSVDYYIQQYFQEKNWELPTYMGGTFNRANAEVDELRKFDDRLREASSSYREKYGTGSFLESGGIKLASSTIFEPARVLYPEVKAKDIKAWEWALGGAQVASIAIPVGVGISRIPNLGAKVMSSAMESRGLWGKVVTPHDIIIGKTPFLEFESIPKSVPFWAIKGITPGYTLGEITALGSQALSQSRMSSASAQRMSSGYAGLEAMRSADQAIRLSRYPVAGDIGYGGRVVIEPSEVSPLIKYDIGKAIKENPLELQRIVKRVGDNKYVSSVEQGSPYATRAYGELGGGYTASGEPFTWQYEPPRIKSFYTGETKIPTKPEVIISSSPSRLSTSTISRQSSGVYSNEPLQMDVTFVKTSSGLLFPRFVPVPFVVTNPIANPLIQPIKKTSPTVFPDYSPVVSPIVNPTVSPVIISTPFMKTSPDVSIVSVTPEAKVATIASATTTILTTTSAVPTIVKPVNPIPVTPKPPAPIKPPIIPPVIPPKFGGSLRGSRGSGGNMGLPSSYLKKFQNIPGLTVYMPTWKGIKSSTTPGNIIGNGKFAEMPESEFEETPFGKKAIRVVVSGSKITSGAKRLGASYKSSIIPEETYLGHKISNRNYTGALG